MAVLRLFVRGACNVAELFNSLPIALLAALEVWDACVWVQAHLVAGIPTPDMLLWSSYLVRTATLVNKDRRQNSSDLGWCNPKLATPLHQPVVQEELNLSLPIRYSNGGTTFSANEKMLFAVDAWKLKLQCQILIAHTAMHNENLWAKSTDWVTH